MVGLIFGIFRYVNEAKSVNKDSPIGWLPNKGETENVQTIIHSCQGKSKVKYVSSLTGTSSWDDLHNRQARSVRLIQS